MELILSEFISPFFACDYIPISPGCHGGSRSMELIKTQFCQYIDICNKLFRFYPVKYLHLREKYGSKGTISGPRQTIFK